MVADGIEIFELVPPESLLDDDQQTSLLTPQTSNWRDPGHLRRLRAGQAARVVSRLSESACGAVRYDTGASLALNIISRGHRRSHVDDLTTEANDKTMHTRAGGIRLEERRPIIGRTPR